MDETLYRFVHWTILVAGAIHLVSLLCIGAIGLTIASLIHEAKEDIQDLMVEIDLALAAFCDRVSYLPPPDMKQKVWKYLYHCMIVFAFSVFTVMFWR
jgi:hypothetical protein